MPDTGITFSSTVNQRMATGHNAMLAPVANSDLPAPLAGAGALRSSANDMLTFLEAFLGYEESLLSPAMKAMLEVRRPAGQATIGLGWIIIQLTAERSSGMTEQPEASTRSLDMMWKRGPALLYCLMHLLRAASTISVFIC